MRYEPGFLADLRNDLANVRPDIKMRLNRRGALTEDRLQALIAGVQTDDIAEAEHASSGDITNYDDLYDWRPACDAIKAGEIAFVVLAGGAGTRVGGSKAFMRLPTLGITLTANKLVQSGFVTHKGEIIQAQAWFMTAPEIFKKMALHLGGLSPQPKGVIFEQFESYRLSVDNRLIFTVPGVPELYPSGHGDVGPAIVESGVLADYPNVKHVVIVNCDNVLASMDPMVLTHHLTTGAHVTCELVERQKMDRGGIPIWVDNRLQVVEDFRLPADFVEGARYHNTNTMIVSIEALKTEIPWRWNRVRKQAGNRLVVQYERLVQQYTEVFPTQYVLVDRKRRYLPIKSEADLVRADEVMNGNKR